MRKLNLFMVFAAMALGGCALASKFSTSAEAGGASVDGATEVSLKADRTQLETLRKEIPEDLRRENDERAVVLGLMASGEDPVKIRERFGKLVRDRRTTVDRDLRRRRESFSRQAQESREAFLKKTKAERESFTARRLDSKERARLFEEQDRRRREFFADQQDERRRFESEVTETRKAFEDHIREQTNRFNAELREYAATYLERRKAEALKAGAERKTIDKTLDKTRAGVTPAAGSTATAGELDEFRNIPSGAATPLAPAEEN